MNTQHLPLALLATTALAVASLQAQSTAFSDTFTRADVNTGTELGSTAIGNGWTFNSDNNGRGGAQIISNTMKIGQESAPGYAGSGGADRSWVWQDNSTWSGYNTTLKNNGGLVSWSFNIRMGSTAPTSFAIGGGASIGVFLGANLPGSSDWMFDGGLVGYALIYGQGGSEGPDPLRLVRVSGGGFRNGTFTDIVVPTTSPFNQLNSGSSPGTGALFLSVQVTYDPASDQWSLFGRNDGFNGIRDPLDPAFGELNLLGTGTDSTYTSQELGYFGFASNGNNGNSGSTDDREFDNVLVSVVPEPSVVALVGVGLGALLLRARRSRRS